jgi:MFS family permease
MNRQLMILLLGRIVTNFADSLYMIATVWYVKSMTDSALLVGLTSAIAILPVTIQFLYGPIIDRYSKRRILFIAEIGQGIIVGLISLLYFTDALWLPLLFVLMFFALSLSEATYPTESALIERLTSREKLTKVNSIFSFSYQALDIICDAVSGILITFIGLGYIYISNSFLLICTGLMFLIYLNIPKSKKECDSEKSSFFKQYKEDFINGFYVVKKQKVLLSILFGVIFINVIATMGLAMLPVISKTPAEYGFWLTALSIGTLTGTVLASKIYKLPLNWVFPFVSLLSGILWCLSVFINDHLLFPYILFGMSWVGVGILSIYVQTLIQVNLPSEYLGIGFAFLSSLLGSLSPIGYFLGGLIGEFTSGSLVLFLASLGYIIFAIYFLLHPKLRKLNNPLSVSFEKM